MVVLSRFSLLFVILAMVCIKNNKEKNNEILYTPMFWTLLIACIIFAKSMAPPNQKLEYEVIIDKDAEVVEYVILSEYKDEYIIADCNELEINDTMKVDLRKGYKRYLPNKRE